MAFNGEIIDIEQEYAKNVNLKREDIKILREFVETQYPATSDFQLFLFLHSCYYDTEKAKHTIDSYYKLRANWPEVFRNRNPNVPPLLDHMYVVVEWPLKYCTDEGYKVIYVKIMNTDYTQFDFEGHIKMFFIVLERWLTAVGNADGFIAILDCSGLTWGHVPKFGINALRKLVGYVQEAIPLRLKGICCMNAVPMAEKILTVAKAFMKKELADIIYLNSDFESLYQHVPKRCLPKDYGGDDVTIQELHQNMIDNVTNNPELFEENEDTKADKFTYLEDVY